MDALILDMDGVISDTNIIQAAAESKMLEKHFKIKISPQEIARRFSGRSIADMLKELFIQHGVTGDIKAFTTERDTVLFEMAQGNIRPMPGALELIERTQKADIPLAIASSSSFNFIELVISSLNIKDAFLAIVSGEDVKETKPHPEIFLRASDQLHTPPNKCVVVEDSHAGALAAERAGMKCVVFAPRFTWKNYPFSAIRKDRLDEITVDFIKNL